MGEKRGLYSQSSNLRHVVEAGDQDTADVVVVEGAAETEEKGSWSAGEQRRGGGGMDVTARETAAQQPWASGAAGDRRPHLRVVREAPIPFSGGPLLPLLPSRDLLTHLEQQFDP